MNETGKLLLQFCLAYLCSEFFYCFCLFNMWRCDICSQVEHQFELQQFFAQCGCTAYAEYRAWETDCLGVCYCSGVWHVTFSYLPVWGRQSAQVRDSPLCATCLCIISWFLGVVWFLACWLLSEFCIKINFCVTENIAHICYVCVDQLVNAV
jgi:hypothetical protein